MKKAPLNTTEVRFKMLFY